MTPEQAAELKRLAEEYVDDAIYMENPERDSGAAIRNYDASQKAFWAYIDSLTQPPVQAELTDEEIDDVWTTWYLNGNSGNSYADSRRFARSIIAADRAKRGTV